MNKSFGWMNCTDSEKKPTPLVFACGISSRHFVTELQSESIERSFWLYIYAQYNVQQVVLDQTY